MQWAIRRGKLRRRTLLLVSVSPCVWAIGIVGGALHAQPAPNAQPLGGIVSAGQASISQTTRATTVTQSSSRAVVDWRSFDVGSQQSVQFAQPSDSAVTLNRVNSPNASQIAGAINANGQVVIVNQSGVVFSKGSQVNAQSLVVSAAGITNQNFMAGKMVFDQAANPNARVENDGSITVKQTGLAALVAPQVVNNGVIRAKMGNVVLAGARTATLDLYGDGLLSLDVSSQVRQAPVGPDGKAVTSLVTNNGLINAAGGTILLTASAADGVVQNLVTANGRVYADTVAGRTGTVVVSGTGGSVEVLGRIRTAGRTAGSVGGQIEVNASGAVSVASTARINASGKAGGGVVAIGTTLARAKGGATVIPTLTAASVNLANGATIAADALAKGNGGRITLLSSGTTSFQGQITARGGPNGGNGGTVEVSGVQVSLGGNVDVRAPLGTMGTILLDPLDLYVCNLDGGCPDAELFAITTPNAVAPNVTAAGFPDAATASYITPAMLAALTGNIELQATRDLFVYDPVTLTGLGQGLSLEAGRDLTVNANIVVPGVLYLKANTADDPTNPGNLIIGSPISGGVVYLSSTSTLGIAINQLVTSTGPTQLITVACDCYINSGLSLGLSAPEGTIEYGPATNGYNQTMLSVDKSFFGAPSLRYGLTHDPISGTQALDGTLVLGSTAGPIVFAGKNLELDASGSVTQLAGSYLSGVGTLSGTVGSAAINNAGNTINSLGNFAATGALSINNAQALTVAGAVSSGTSLSLSVLGPLALGTPTTPGTLSSPGSIALMANAITEPNGGINAGTLSGNATSATLSGPNTIGGLGNFTTTGGFSLNNTQGLVVAGEVNGGTGLSLSSTGSLTLGTSTSPGTLISSGTVALTANGITEPNGSINAPTLTGSSGGAADLGGQNSIATLGAFTAANTLTLNDMTGLTVSGPVSAGVVTLATAGSLGFAGAVNAGTLQVQSGADITQASGIITTGTLAGFAGGSVVLDGQISFATLGTFQTAGNLVLNDTGNLVVAGPLTVGSSAAISTQGDIALSSDVSAGSLALTATGSITQPSGVVTAGTLSGNANSTTLTQSNQIQMLGAFTSSNVFNLNDATVLNVSGPVSSNTLALNASGPIVFGGTVKANSLRLNSANSITQVNGSTITADTLSGAASGAVSLTGNNAIGAINGIAVSGPGSFSLNDRGNLQIDGMLSAAKITVSDPSGHISLDDGATIVTGGTARPSGLLAPSALRPDNGALGAYFVAASFSQTGRSMVGGQGGGPATFQIATTGNIQFDSLLGLQSNNTWLILNLTNGTASGNVIVKSLDLSYGSPGGAHLSGTVQGISGPLAATAGYIQPATNSNYQFNGCTIGSTICLLAANPVSTKSVVAISNGVSNVVSSMLDAVTAGPAQSSQQATLPGVPFVNPMRDLAGGPLRKQQVDPDLLLPNVSEKDY